MPQQRRRSKKWLRTLIRWVLILVAIAAAWFFGGWVLIDGPALLDTQWIPNEFDNARAARRLRLINILVLTLGGMIAIIGVVLGISRHHEELAANRRDQDRLDAERDKELRARYVTAVELLSDSKRPIKRSAALHALGALADDWAAVDKDEEVQVCIDTITAYLRQPVTVMPSVSLADIPNASTSVQEFPPDTDHILPTPISEVTVRTTGYNIIRAHLQRFSPNSWSATKINLHGAHIDHELDLSNIFIDSHGEINLSEATISGGCTVNLDHTDILEFGTLNLSKIKVSEGSIVNLRQARVTGSTIDLGKAEITGGSTVDLSRAWVNRNSTIDLGEAEITGGSTVDLSEAQFSKGSVFSMSDAGILGGSTVRLKNTMIINSRVDLNKIWAINGVVDLSDATITLGVVHLKDSIVSGSYIILHETLITQNIIYLLDSNINNNRIDRQEAIFKDNTFNLGDAESFDTNR